MILLCHGPLCPPRRGAKSLTEAKKSSRTSTARPNGRTATSECNTVPLYVPAPCSLTAPPSFHPDVQDIIDSLTRNLAISPNKLAALTAELAQVRCRLSRLCGCHWCPSTRTPSPLLPTLQICEFSDSKPALRHLLEHCVGLLRVEIAPEKKVVEEFSSKDLKRLAVFLEDRLSQRASQQQHQQQHTASLQASELLADAFAFIADVEKDVQLRDALLSLPYVRSIATTSVSADAAAEQVQLSSGSGNGASSTISSSGSSSIEEGSVEPPKVATAVDFVDHVVRSGNLRSTLVLLKLLLCALEGGGRGARPLEQLREAAATDRIGPNIFSEVLEDLPVVVAEEPAGGLVVVVDALDFKVALRTGPIGRGPAAGQTGGRPVAAAAAAGVTALALALPAGVLRPPGVAHVPVVLRPPRPRVLRGGRRVGGRFGFGRRRRRGLLRR